MVISKIVQNVSIYYFMMLVLQSDDCIMSNYNKMYGDGRM